MTIRPDATLLGGVRSSNFESLYALVLILISQMPLDEVRNGGRDMSLELSAWTPLRTVTVTVCAAFLEHKYPGHD